MKEPFRAAVIIPARDGLPDVLDAVESALAQTHPPVEIVVVDDSSTDGTGDAVERRFGSKVRLLRGRYGSAAAARNAAWRSSDAPWMAFLDADDLWFPEKLESAAAALHEHPEAAWFFSDGHFRTLEGELQPSWFRTYAELRGPYLGQPVAELFEVNFILMSSVVVRRDALDCCGGFDESRSHAEDLDMWIRLARRWPAVATPRALVRYQHRAGGLTRQTEARLGADVTLFRRLASDADLPARLRRRARRRESLAQYKLAVFALKQGRRAEARAHLRWAWLFPERTVAVAVAWVASHLPAPVLRQLRRQRWAMRSLAAPLVRVPRVVLDGGSEWTLHPEGRRT